MKRLVILLVLTLVACGRVDFENAEPGKMSGAALVMWVGSGEPSRLGNGKFLFVPVRNAPLTFMRSGGEDASKAITIQPEPFYTDGGSIPRVVQAFPGFAAWGYGPAYIVHDWLFVARKCLNTDRRDGTDTASPEMKKIATLTFQDSADVLAEAIRTLERDFGADDGGGATISSVTAGPISARLWRDYGPCTDRLDPAHQKFIDDLNNRVRVMRSGALRGLARSGPVRLSNGDTIEVVDIITLN